ncbi:hypothetical protein [Arthrobacter glacialis]|uniref:Uncharacterized protein n=1 Tax=Arthrobacter glacialis TaxID=1664 RepID=A0A2S3ZSX3_ARTGL|nr:hypothetical protein [Arthrobacter glacialis]POH72179.1 hypothetical protein CVS27_16945 [Arthrobacter glacialis]
MALTKNSRAAAARSKAAELARAAQSREAELLRLAGEYFIEKGEAGAVEADAKAKGLELIEAAKKRAQDLEADAFFAAAEHEVNANAVLVKMLATGASIEDVASRVELSAGSVRKIKKASTDKAPKGEAVAEVPEHEVLAGTDGHAQSEHHG